MFPYLRKLYRKFAQPCINFIIYQILYPCIALLKMLYNCTWFGWPFILDSGGHTSSTTHQSPTIDLVAQSVDRYFIESKQDLAKLWSVLNFDTNFRLLRRLIEQYGLEKVIRQRDSCGKTLAHWIVARCGDVHAFKLIANVDHSSLAQWRQDRKFPLLHLAIIEADNMDMVTTLVYQYGFDINIQNVDGHNAMMAAIVQIDNTKSETIKTYNAILRCVILGIDVDDRSVIDGSTALHKAVEKQCLQSIYLLVYLGANFCHLRDSITNRTAYDIVVQKRLKSIMKLMMNTNATGTGTTPTTTTKTIRKRITSSICDYFYRLFNEPNFRRAQLRYATGAVVFVIEAALIFGLILPIYFGDYIHRFDTYLPLHGIIFLTISLCILFCIRTMFYGKGETFLVKKNGGYYRKFMKYFVENQQQNHPTSRLRTFDHLLYEQQYHLCHICQCVAPVLTKHCYYCGGCALEYDHHCIFLFTCIGRGNLHSFLLFMFTMCLNGLAGMVTVGFIIYDDYKHLISFEYQLLHSYLNAYDLDDESGFDTGELMDDDLINQTSTPSITELYINTEYWILLLNAIKLYEFIFFLVCFKLFIVGFVMTLITIVRRRCYTKIRMENGDLSSQTPELVEF